MMGKTTPLFRKCSCIQPILIDGPLCGCITNRHWNVPHELGGAALLNSWYLQIVDFLCELSPLKTAQRVIS